MKIGSLFSGIGGLELGLEWSGLGEVVWQVEMDPFCRAGLARNYPGVVRRSDVRTCGRANLEPVDIIVGGFPCQDVSGAGKGAGLAGSRSGLWFEFARIVDELRPLWVVVENVASGAGRWVDAIMAGLEQLGYEGLPIPLSAEDVGAPHLRRRVFVVARSVSDADEVRRGERSRAWVDHARGAVAANGVLAVPDADSEQLRDERQRLTGGRSTGVRAQGDTEPGVDSIAVADGSCDGQREQRPGDEPIVGFEHDAPRHKPHRRPEGLVFPPRPGDVEGWFAWIDQGGPEPGVLPGADGIPAGLAATDAASGEIVLTKEAAQIIAACGNAVVPQCAEVIGWVIQELERST